MKLTIYKAGYNVRSPRWAHGEWGNRNAVGKLMLLPAIILLAAILAVATMLAIVVRAVDAISPWR